MSQASTPPQPESLPHKPADDREEVYYQGSPLLRGDLFRTFLWYLAGLILLVVAIGGWALDYGLPLWVWLIPGLLGGLCLLIPTVLARSVRFRISNYRIDYEHGLLSRSIDTLELWHVEDIKLHQSLMDRIFNVGTITIVSHDETTPNLDLRSVRNPRPLFEILKQRIIAVKRQRGVIKMDIG